MELLAPCGGQEHVEAAVRCGADAVYLGLQQLSARGKAENFTRDTLGQAVSYCHRHGVKVYLAVNTLLTDRQAPLLTETLETARELSVDALIVQDWGAAHFIRRKIPSMPLHASTQCAIHTPAAVRLARELGFARVVLARELTAGQIGEIISQTGMPCEVFVHGALCGGVSGQCYFSAMLGGRSGNRGLCAQPCRLEIKGEGGDYALSLRDLSLLSHIERLRQLGVCSLKIEGRMKRPEYTAAAVTACRDALEGRPFDIDGLEAVFSRSGFTDGYFTGHVRDMGGIRRREDVQATKAILPELSRLTSDIRKRQTISLSLVMKRDEPTVLTASLGNRSLSVTGEVPQKARTRPTTLEEARNQLGKWGDTPFRMEDFSAELDEGVVLPLSQLNALRRALSKRLFQANEAALTNDYPMTREEWGRGEPVVPCKGKEAPKVPGKEGEGSTAHCKEKVFHGECRRVAQWQALDEAGLSGSLPLDVLLTHDDILPHERLMVSLPRWMGEGEKALRQGLAVLRNRGFSHLLCHNLGHIAMGRDLGFTLHGGWALNVCNHRAATALGEMGLADLVLSVELPLSHSPGGAEAGRVVYGRIPLMLLARCPLHDRKSCRNRTQCSEPAALTDRKGKILPLICGNGAVEVLNPHTLWMADLLSRVPERHLWFLFDRHTKAETAAVLAAYRQGSPPPKTFTRGLLLRGLGSVKQ